MVVSTKGRYGLRVLLAVALHQKEGPVTLADISRRQGISQKYLWQVINPLKGAGLLSATRGARGGYVLARTPASLTMREILAILEGPIVLSACAAGATGCERRTDCAAAEVWSEIEDQLNNILQSITLKGILQRSKDREDRGVPNYDI
jgi:Rrf2 family protein